MRRLVVEIDATDISRYIKQSPEWIEKIQSLEVLSFLRDTPRESALICRISLRDSAASVRDIFNAKDLEIQILEEEKKGTYICFVKKKRAQDAAQSYFMDVGGYLSTPYELIDGKIRATFLGSAVQVRKLLKVLKKLGLKYNIASLTDARFSPNSPLANLTEKQRRVLTTAYNLGYYDLPKKVSSEALARELHMRSSTLVIHRIKAERRLIAENLKQG
jgi:predicted DNA binding protein